MADTYNITVTVSNLKGETGNTGLQGPQGIPGEVQTADLNAALALKANLASPTLTGVPAAPTAATATNTTQIATTAFVRANRTELEVVDALKAPIASPALTGTPTAPTASVATNTTQIATTAFVRANRAELDAVDTTKAPLVSPTFTGTPAAPTAATDTNTTQIATTAYVRANRLELQAAIDLKAPINNPSFTGNVIVPTADAPTEAVNKAQMEAAITAADDANFTVISPNPPETNKPGRVWLKTPQLHAAISASGNNFAPLWPPTDNRAVEAKAAVTLLKEAVGWWDAAYAVPGEQYAVNRGSGGAVLNAQYGSTTGVDTNDPILTPHDGRNHAYIPSLGANYLNLAADPNLNMLTGGEIVVRIALDAWSLGVGSPIVSRYEGVAGSWEFNIGGGGGTNKRLRLNLHDGIALSDYICLADVPFSNGQRGWVRCVWTPDDGLGASLAKFYWAPDSDDEPSAWTQLGADVTKPVFVPTSGDRSIRIGQRSASSVRGPAGEYYRVIVRTPNGSSTLIDVDLQRNVSSGSAASFTATTGQTVTVQRATAGPKTLIITRPVWLFGTDDYMIVPHDPLLIFGASDSFTAMIVYRMWATPTTSGRQLAKGPVGGVNSWGISNSSTTFTPRFMLYGDTENTLASAPAPAAGQMLTAIGVRDRTSGYATMFANNAPGTPLLEDTTGTLDAGQPLYIGMVVGGGGTQVDMELVAAAVFRRALTANEILLINNFYGTV